MAKTCHACDCLLLALALRDSDPLLDDGRRHLCVRVSRDTRVTPDNALPDNPIILGNLIDVVLLVVLPVVLGPRDLTRVAMAGPHSESLAGLEAQNVLVHADVEPTVTRVELVARKAVNLSLVRHTKGRPNGPSQLKSDTLSSFYTAADRDH